MQLRGPGGEQQSTSDAEGSSRPRVLVLVTYGFSVRYLVPTGILDALDGICDLVVGVGWDDEALMADLAGRSHHAVRLPDAQLDHTYRMYRKRLQAIHLRRLKPVGRRPKNRLNGWSAGQLVTDGRELAAAVLSRVPAWVRATEAGEAEVVADHTNVADFRRFLDDQGIDLVVSLTPYHDQDTLALWAASELGVPHLTSVISFDNPTTRGRLAVRSPRTLVWNRFNRDELLRAYGDLDPESIAIIGAPQFDLHHRADLVLPEDEWRRRLGIPPERPVILYGAGPGPLVPHEERLVLLIDGAIADGRIPGDPFLLVRRHPVEPPEAWEALDRRLRSGKVVDPWAAGSDPMRSWPSDDDIEIQMSSLAHSVVHVNVGSSMTLDGAAFDRPQVGPTFVPGATRNEHRRVRSFYGQEHWLPLARSGGLVTVDDPGALIDAIVAGLRSPDTGHEGRMRMLRDVLTYDDGQSSKRFVDEVAAFLRQSGRPAAERRP